MITQLQYKSVQAADAAGDQRAGAMVEVELQQWSHAVLYHQAAPAPRDGTGGAASQHAGQPPRALGSGLIVLTDPEVRFHLSYPRQSLCSHRAPIIKFGLLLVTGSFYEEARVASFLMVCRDHTRVAMLLVQVGRPNPAEMKATKLARSGAADADLDAKPDAEEKRNIAAILAYPPNRC